MRRSFRLPIGSSRDRTTTLKTSDARSDHKTIPRRCAFVHCSAECTQVEINMIHVGLVYHNMLLWSCCWHAEPLGLKPGLARDMEISWQQCFSVPLRLLEGSASPCFQNSCSMEPNGTTSRPSEHLLVDFGNKACKKGHHLPWCDSHRCDSRSAVLSH